MRSSAGESERGGGRAAVAFGPSPNVEGEQRLGVVVEDGPGARPLGDGRVGGVAQVDGEDLVELEGGVAAPQDIIFFFNDTATTEIYTLSLHDALPISAGGAAGAARIP